jgi:hypothetical protein
MRNKIETDQVWTDGIDTYVIGEIDPVSNSAIDYYRTAMATLVRSNAGKPLYTGVFAYLDNDGYANMDAQWYIKGSGSPVEIVQKPKVSWACNCGCYRQLCTYHKVDDVSCIEESPL